MATPYVTYTNETEDSVQLPDGTKYEPGQTRERAKYHRDLLSLSLMEQRWAPWKTLLAEPVPASVAGGLALYNQLIIVNGTGDDLTVVANEDDDNPLTLLADMTWPISQDREINTLEFEGDGSGNVYLYGMRGAE
jgi:hypothetical protein